MDQKVIKYYRKLLKEGFSNAGSLENPSILLDTVGEKIRICGHAGENHMYVYIAVAEDEKQTLSDCKYLCNCNPTANVVVEILCTLIKGRTLNEVEKLGVDDFVRVLDSSGEEFLEKSNGIVELLGRGIRRYHGKAS